MTKQKYNEILREISYPNIGKYILSLILKFRYISNDENLINNCFSDTKKWKIVKTIKELKALGYIKALAIECNKKYNKKDSLTVTNKGFRLSREIGIQVPNNWKSMAQSKKIWRQRSICTMSFYKLPQEIIYINSYTLVKNGDLAENNQFCGLCASGYIVLSDIAYAIYSVEKNNMCIFENREHNGLEKAKYLNNPKSKYNRKYNRIILVDSPETVQSLLQTKKGTKWRNNGNKMIGCNIKNALFYNGETSFRGEAFVFDRCSINNDMLLLYTNPNYVNNEINNVILNACSTITSKIGKINEYKKYFFSVLETDKLVVFNLFLHDLHAMAEIYNIVKNNEDKRKLIIYCFFEDSYFFKSVYSNKIATNSISKEIIIKILKNTANNCILP